MSYAVIADWRTILIALISFTVAFKKNKQCYSSIGWLIMGYLLTFIG
jgi:hypothetical protein